MSASPLRVAFVGAGQMARHHLTVVTRQNAVVVGVCDRATNQAREFVATAPTPIYSSLDAMLAEARPDIVHICTPPNSHFDVAHAALDAGAHIYVEKPFALTMSDARTLLDLAGARGRSVCAGHQLLRDRGFEALTARAAELGTVLQADSHFAFKPAQMRADRASATALADLAVDILPHPLYTLVDVLERVSPTPHTIELEWAHAGPADVQAILRAGDVIGRLSVTLQGRPVASSLTLIGTKGSLACDFVRSNLIGAGNPGTAALEKVLNPMVEGAQMATGTAASVARRISSGIAYPGLAELIGEFYASVAAHRPSPVSPDHLLRVTDLFERLVIQLRAAERRHQHVTVPSAVVSGEPLAVVTGAGGFLGGEIARALLHVRGIGRGPDPANPNIQEWVRADLSSGVSPDAIAGADVVIHAVAEMQGGGYEAHQRNTLDATRHLLNAMHAAGVSRLVLVSSLSVLRPPRLWERQDEQTPRPADPRLQGPYSWGKCLQEELVEREARALGIEVRIIRPGALVDEREPELPGLMGRHLYGRWYLGLGRPGLPIAVCEVARCARAIAWCAQHFDEAPAVVNLFEPEVATRGSFAARLRSRGWNGRIVYVPISAVAIGLMAARKLFAMLRGERAEPLAAWSILRPRRYDARLTTELLGAARDKRQVQAAGIAVPA
jgi:predicted dehydrogenase/nucleoside-diphosphate-sugar epimerase